ncbi:MAG: TRAP transporter large permease subunit [Bosea sp.]|jgi:TRAP-type mannitol/chloroaromatic compound transport system permease large subunit|nr:TRAP transporter large permease subunit [Bosea sp. (in: a-proteobacteria)]
MTQFIITYLSPIMFVSLIGFLLLGFPVAFTLAANGLIFGYIGIAFGLFTPNFLQALPERVFGIMANETLLAIPFFTFMGLILERSRMAEDLLDTIGQLFGTVRGGLAYAVIFVGALMAATTGVVAAAVISMGLISLPIMLRYGYDRQLATGVIMASGTLAQIIPPSLVLIVLADVLGRSVGDFYQGAIIPGLMLTGAYALYVFVLTLINPKAGPPLPPEARTLGAGVTSLFVMIGLSALVGVGATMLFTPHVEQAPHVYGASVAVIFALAVAIANKRFKLKVLSYLAERVIMVLVPPLALIFLVLGTIFIGLATPTEGGAMGAVGALVLAAMNGRLTFTLTKQACESTLKLSAFVMFILIGARVFALTFYGINGHVWVKELMLSLPGGAVGFIIFTNFVVFILGCFIDFFEIAFILMPLLVAPAEALKIDIVWFGVLMAMNMQTSFLTPPFGFALFYLRSVAPRLNYTDKVTGKLIEGVQTTTLYRGVIPFILLQVFMVVVVYFWPQLVLHYKDAIVAVDPADVQRQLDNLIIPGLGGPGADEPPPLRF